MIVKALQQAGFNFKKTPDPIKKTFESLDKYTEGTLETDNQKVNVLDHTLWKAIYSLYGNDESVQVVKGMYDYNAERINNDSFNTVIIEKETIDQPTSLNDLDQQGGQLTLFKDGGKVQKEYVIESKGWNYAQKSIDRKKEQIKELQKRLIPELSTNIENDGATKIGYRQDKFENTKFIIGRERNIILANGESHKSYFAIVELDEILASHHEQTFSDTKDYPVNSRGNNINDRNYKDDKNAQAKVKEVAQRLNPNIIISTSATASGTPIITVDGIVISGNNRTMSLKLATDQHPEKYEQYKKALREEIEAGGYGIDEIKGFKKPVLVRIDTEFNAYTTEEMNKYNKSRSKSERPIDLAIRLSSQLADNEGCQSALIAVLESYDTLSELYGNKNDVGRIQKIMLDCNIITSNEIASYFQQGQLLPAGKDLLENLLASLVLTEEALKASEVKGVKSYKQKVVSALPPLVKNKAMEGTIIPELNQAILLQNKIVASGLDFDEYLSQSDIFEAKIVPTKVKALNRIMSKGRYGLKKIIEKYNTTLEQNQGESLFGDNLTPEQIFNQIVLPEVQIEPEKPVTLVSLRERIEGLKLVYEYDPSEHLKDRIEGLELSLSLENDTSNSS